MIRNTINKILLAIKRDGLLRFFMLKSLHLSTYVIALPFALAFIVIYRWTPIRLIKLFSYRIGHYALNTELMLCAKQSVIFGDKKIITLYYTMPNERICNKQLHIMWKRVIPILPLPLICEKIDNLLGVFLGDRYKNDPLKQYFESTLGATDKWGFLESIKECHIRFTYKENKAAKNLMSKLGIPPTAQFICILGRDSTYLDKELPQNDWSYQDYRNMEIKDYQKSADYLAGQGYYVIRMGKHVKDTFNSNNSKIIDYANSFYRSDFLDIYLSANCFFFVSPRTGIDAVAQIFRRPLLLINFPLCDIDALYSVNLFIPKAVISLKKNTLLFFREMCWSENRQEIKLFLQQRNWTFVNNTPDEILETVIEMLARLLGLWNASSEHKYLQHQFWTSMPIMPPTGQITIGEYFLKRYKMLLTSTTEESH